jgi:hypothetical protein
MNNLMLETATSQQCAIYKFPQCPCFVFFSFGVVFQIHCGRIEHNPIDGQFGADKTRVDEIRKKCPLMYVELNPGKLSYRDTSTICTCIAVTQFTWI